MKLKDFAQKCIFLPTMLLLLGCIQNSPLLNHAEAQDLAAKNSDSIKGCAFLFPVNHLCASMDWTKLPSEDEKGEFTLRFWDSQKGTEAGPFVDPGFTVAVKLFMPAMGHGSSPVVVTQALDSGGQTIAGVFEAKEVYFVMPGAWEIWTHLKKGSTIVEKAKIDFQD